MSDEISMRYNLSLLIAAALNFLATIMHLLIIYFGAAWYRFFGAGEHTAQMAERGDMAATYITALIAAGLSVFGLYALQGAGVNLRLPFTKFALIGITAIYFLRGMLFIPFLQPVGHVVADGFWAWSSAIVLVFAAFHFVGLKQRWAEL